jgi:hypothetical protein
MARRPTRKGTGGTRAASKGRKGAGATRSRAGATKTVQAKRSSARVGARNATAKGGAGASQKRARTRRRPAPSRLERQRRTLEETVPTPPSSLNMNRRGSAARSGRAELEETRRNHQTMSPDLAAGDVDANVENAYFTGEESPGGDNPTPDQDIVDDIGKALGVQYEDNEELKASDKVAERDKHRWELDPASAEDYKDRQ